MSSKFNMEGFRYWLTLCVTVVVLALLAMRVHFSEDISAFFPKTDDHADYVVRHLKAMDRVSFIFEADSASEADLGLLADAAECCAARIEDFCASDVTVSLFYGEEQMAAMADFVYEHLPVLLSSNELCAIEARLCSDSIKSSLADLANLMRTPAGSFVAPIVGRDPLMMGLPVLNRLQGLKVGSSVSVSDGYLTSSDGRRLIMFADFVDGYASTGNNEAIVDSLVAFARAAEADFGVRVHAFGAPLVTVSNSRCVKADEWRTLSIAIVVMSLVFYLVFGRVRSVLLLLVPVAFGALFALGVIGALGIDVSLMAIGTGATILGVALGYSIHMITHGLHVANPHQLVREMAFPMVVGSFTTVGAFVALLFTGSQVLRDLGIFASLALVGTLVFCLLFLPRLMCYSVSGHDEGGPLLRFVQRIAGRDYSNSTPLVAVLAILFVVCLFTFSNVRFNPDMSALNYKGDVRLQEAQAKLEETFGVGGHETQVVVCADNAQSLALGACRLDSVAQTITDGGRALVHKVQTIAPDFLLPQDSISLRAERWNRLWSPQRQSQVMADVRSNAARLGFAPDAFDLFERSISQTASGIAIPVEKYALSPIFAEWLSLSNGKPMLYANLEVDVQARDSVLALLASNANVVPTDMGFFTRQMATSMVADFNWLLALSSVIVALALIFSYGRVELFLMTFMPMVVSWVIILGLMAIFGVEFNVVNIILSTFIFGVGDDYSIFIMDGLREDYLCGKNVMASHKTAIALSAFAAIAGLGAQVFGNHPAVQSLGLISIFGLVAVIITSFVVQPVLFRIFISKPSQVGYSFTLLSFLRTIGIYSLFGLICIVFQILGCVAVLFVHPARVRRAVLHRIVYWCMRLFVFVVRPVIARPVAINFSRPSVIVANHQSMVDIISLLAASPKVVFVVKDWVSGSLIMGLVTRMLGFYTAGRESSDRMVDTLRVLANEGYSIVVFPEGSRSADGLIHRFHKGAFFLSHKLQLPVTPIVFYGNNYVISRRQPMQIMMGRMAVDVLPSVLPPTSWVSDDELNASVKLMMRQVQQTMRDHLDGLSQREDSQNEFFLSALSRGSLYRSGLTRRSLKAILSKAGLLSCDGNPGDSFVVLTNDDCDVETVAFWIALHGRNRSVSAFSSDADAVARSLHSPLMNRVVDRGSSLSVALISDAPADLSAYDHVVDLRSL